MFKKKKKRPNLRISPECILSVYEIAKEQTAQKSNNLKTRSLWLLILLSTLGAALKSPRAWIT